MNVDVTSSSSASEPQSDAHDIRDITRTTCCIVGGGPAGAVLALLLARKNIPVMLLEAHTDFDRDFRGDTIHPSVMELMEELGLADRLLQLPHTKLRRVTLPTPRGPVTLAPFVRLKTRYPYITMMPQVKFLNFIAAEAQRYPSFKLIMGARVEQLVEDGSVVRGVRYQGQDGWHELRALLTVGADGRFSRLRRLAGMTPVTTSPPMDILWFRLPREREDPEDVMGRFKNGHMLILLNRWETWQAGYIVPKGSYKKLHDTGLPTLRQSIAEMIPELAARVDSLTDWKQVSLLSVASDRLPRWYRPGLLLIGDAAHVMSPVFGIGINFAIQDAIVAANVLAEPLKTGRLHLRHLRSIQRQREWPTWIVQALQAGAQRVIANTVLNPAERFEGPTVLRILTRVPLLRDLPGKFLAYGIWPVHANI
jgi:2-polyprenyl-6-methoxyphenol hydroxylase-like FAD-dependent oxidoreductase